MKSNTTQHSLKSKSFNPEAIKSAALAAMIEDAKQTDDQDSFTPVELASSDKFNRDRNFWYRLATKKVKSGEWIQTIKLVRGKSVISFKKK